jgi:hypothetical protein
LALRPDPPQPPGDKKAEKQAAQQDVFLREVDDALRQDEMLGVFKRWGRSIGAVVFLGLAAFAGYLFWDNQQAKAAGERGEQLTMALDRVDQGGLDLAGKQLDPLARSDGAGTRAAAALMRGGIALQQGKKDEAVRRFAAVADDADAPKPFRDLATIRQVAASFDTMAPQQVVDRLKGLAVPGNPWFGAAGELVGTAYLKQGKNELAGPLFAAISRDKDTPETLRTRARQMASLLGVDAVDDPEKAAGGTGGNSAGGATK